MRLAFVRISQETNCRSPVFSEIEDFERFHLYEGEELLERCGTKGREVDAWLRNAELSGFVKQARKLGAECVPILGAWCPPGGALSTACWTELRRRLIWHLEQAGELDGVYLCAHGAMAIQDVDQADALLVETIREVVGDTPIAVSLDLHANLTPRLVDGPDILVGYRTNPHRDHAKTGARAAGLLVKRVAGEVDPLVTWRNLPMIFGGGWTLDFLQPMRPIFRRMKQYEKDPRVLDVSLFCCHPWNDHPILGWAIHVTTDNAPELGAQIADELADMAWATRRDIPDDLPKIDEALERIKAARWRRRLGTVCVCDVGDVVGAGALGESTEILKALIDDGTLSALVPLRDPTAVEALWDTPEGTEVELDVGGVYAPDLHPPLRVRGVVGAKVEQLAHERCVQLTIGKIELVICDGSAYIARPAFFTEMGLSPWRADLVVVKSFFPFRLLFALQNRMTLYVLTGGVTDLNAVGQLELADKVEPFHEIDCWRDTDQRRRGVSGS